MRLISGLRRVAAGGTRHLRSLFAHQDLKKIHRLLSQGEGQVSTRHSMAEQILLASTILYRASFILFFIFS